MKDVEPNQQVHLPKIIEEKIKKQIDEAAKEPEGAHEMARVEREPTITKISSAEFYAAAGRALEKIAEKRSCPGSKIKSKGKGRGEGRGKGEGPVGVPVGEKGVLSLEEIKKIIKKG